MENISKLIGVLDYERGEVYCVQEEQYTAKEFLFFLEKVLVKYPEQKVVMILDNAKIHPTELIQPFLEKNKKASSLYSIAYNSSMEYSDEAINFYLLIK